MEENLPVERLFAPILPIDILAIGLNYHTHVQEGNRNRIPGMIEAIAGFDE